MTRPYRQRFTEQLRRQLEDGKEPEAAIRAAARAAGGRIVRPPGEAEGKACRRLVAAHYADLGVSYTQMARTYGVSPTTVREWVRIGRQRRAEDPAGCRALLTAWLGAERADELLGPDCDRPG